ncbi:MAG: helix-turn-helix transcriptional regulator [Planctomycetes bacterium]|nr:helix-turn-helix transcriptional regulator [Planctomycetota bacterium]
MRSQLARHFRTVRKERDLSLSQLARLIGYKNVTKGCNKITKFEQRGEIHAGLLWKLADALSIDPTTIDKLIEQDRREFYRVWNEWADVPISPFIVIRLLPAVYKRSELPDGIVSVEEAEIIAAETARRWRKKVYLQWTRRLSIWFNEQGHETARTEATPGEINAPHMRLKGSRRGFQLQHPETGRTVLRLIDWPVQPISIQECTF